MHMYMYMYLNVYQARQANGGGIAINIRSECVRPRLFINVYADSMHRTLHKKTTVVFSRC